MCQARILILNYEYPPLGGGAGNATYNLLRKFSQYSNFEFDLVTSSIDKFKIEKFASNVTIHFLDIGKNITSSPEQGRRMHHQSNKDLLIYSWKAYRYCRKLKKQKKFSLIHAFFGIPCGYIAMKLGLPYIVSLRGSDVPGHNQKFSKIYFWLSPIIKKAWKYAIQVIANSEDLKKEAVAFYQEEAKKILIIVNGVDCEKFQPAQKNDTVFRILYVGRFHKVKGIEYLITAFKRILEKGKDVELMLVGEGELYEEIRNAQEDSKEIKIVGRKSQDELVKIYQQASVLVLPSLNEGMSNVILEAMACGLPIITTDTGGSKELIQGNGFVVPKADSFAICKAITSYLENHALIKQHSKKSRILVEKMSWGKVAEQYKEIYELA